MRRRSSFHARRLAACSQTARSISISCSIRRSREYACAWRESDAPFAGRGPYAAEHGRLRTHPSRFHSSASTDPATDGCFTAEQACCNEPSGDATQCAAEKRIVSANFAWELEQG